MVEILGGSLNPQEQFQQKSKQWYNLNLKKKIL